MFFFPLNEEKEKENWGTLYVARLILAKSIKITLCAGFNLEICAGDDAHNEICFLIDRRVNCSPSNVTISNCVDSRTVGDNAFLIIVRSRSVEVIAACVDTSHRLQLRKSNIDTDTKFR